ncbi:hypothetical protein ACIA58_06285 [Kribbella sp. NPDC051586]|uniref:hypothetical protein n=1 Tax=Kribbella sp. NPDC051586 TaxID=3364118 RepID=UPI0037888F7E
MTITVAASAPTSVEELLAASGETARVLAAADQSAWNGQIVESSGAMLGLAHWDGTLYLDGETILDPLRHLYEHAGEKRLVSTLVRYRESLATLLHEHAHFLGPSDSTQEAAREGFVKPGSRELEEGVTEAWAQDHLDEYIHRLGVDKLAPGIESVPAGGYYAAFVPAVRKLTADLESRNDLPPGEVLNLLNRQTAAGQLPLLVTLVYNSTRLPDLEPTGADTRSRLESILRAGLDHLDTYELTAPGFATTKSLTTANQLLTHLHHEIAHAESAHTFAPIHPNEPAHTSTPTQPHESAHTLTPTQSAAPACTVNPIQPDEPTHTLTPTQPDEPTHTLTPTQPNKPAQPHPNACTLPPPTPNRSAHQVALSGLAPPTTASPSPQPHSPASRATPTPRPRGVPLHRVRSA